MNEAIKSLKIQLELLKMEYEEEKAAFNKISEKIGLTRLAEKGNAWLGIRVGKSYHNSLNREWWNFSATLPTLRRRRP